MTLYIRPLNRIQMRLNLSIQTTVNVSICSFLKGPLYKAWDICNLCPNLDASIQVKSFKDSTTLGSLSAFPFFFFIPLEFLKCFIDSESLLTNPLCNDHCDPKDQLKQKTKPIRDPDFCNPPSFAAILSEDKPGRQAINILHIFCMLM